MSLNPGPATETAFEIRSRQILPMRYVVSVTGEVDAWSSPALADELESIVEAGAIDAVVDLTEVSFVDSSCLRVLLRTLDKFDERGGKLMLVADDRRVLKTFEITGLNAKFVMHSQLAEAMVELASRGSGTDGDGKV